MLRTLDDLFATGLRDDWVARLRGADIVSAPINTLLEASNDPDVVANGYVAEVEYPEARQDSEGARDAVASSPRRRRVSVSRRSLGRTTTPCWGSLGFGAAEIAELRERKII